MLRVDLYTADGGFVTTVIVPPMQPMPDVIVWGDRHFTRDPRAARYVEGFAVAAWTAAEYAAQGRKIPAHALTDWS